jgi:hypothetical protein
MELFKKDYAPTDLASAPLRASSSMRPTTPKAATRAWHSISLRPFMSSSKTTWWPIRSIRNG